MFQKNLKWGENVMKHAPNRLITFSELLEKIGGIIFLIIMFLVVCNIFLRAFFNSPILGTYDFVGFLTAIAIGLSLANCALQKGHIAVDIFIEKFPIKIQSGFDLLTGTTSGLFFLITSWQLVKYGYSMVLSGQKSPTAMISYYPFIYVVAFGIFILSLVVFFQLRDPFNRMVKK